MINQIEPTVREIPEVLRAAAALKKLIPFVGAGLSQLCGCPGWRGFAEATLKFFLDLGHINHAKFQQITTLPPRIQLSIALELQGELGISIDFKKILKVDCMPEPVGAAAYDCLRRMANKFVTTNYDQHLDGMGTAYYHRHDITVERLLEKDPSVFHIHGSVESPSSMVLTTRDYLKQYEGHKLIGGDKEPENRFITFLSTLFECRNVLFVGYGLNEMEILEYVLQKGLDKKSINEVPRHYVLQGFFTHELELARSMERYYRSFGVGLLTYSRDDADWNQQAHVLNELSLQLQMGQSAALSEMADLNQLLNS